MRKHVGDSGLRSTALSPNVADMKISRGVTLMIHFVLDELVPPIIRDRKWFTWLPFKILFGSKSEVFANFKRRGLQMSEEEFSAVYGEIASSGVQRETDLNKGCVTEIERNIAGESVLEVGCGRGYLAGVLSKDNDVTACDIQVPKAMVEKYPRVKFEESNAQDLPFGDASFDTVVCTHTIEHVQDIAQSIRELRRVTRKRLIIVVPRQRPYRHTFDLHLHFFTYPHMFLSHVRPVEGVKGQDLKEVDGDWYYQEEHQC